MKKILFVLFSFLSVVTYAQVNKPEVYSVTTQFERIEIIRMVPGTDMLEGLKKIIADKSIKNAVILSGIGSVTDYHYHVVSDKNLPPAEEDPQASIPMDLVSVQGHILNGRVHVHISLADVNSMVGGHLEPGTKALTFFIITLGVLPDNLDIESFDSYKGQ
jgi:predicted DNA-binding protein with PD1-like motif